MSLLQNLLPSTRSTGDASPALPIKPRFTLRETPESYALTVYLPGVAKDAVEITAEDQQFRLVARRNWNQPKGWSPVFDEIDNANFELVFNYSNAINAEKISAELNDGVLQVTLPKTEAVKPRKIAVS